MGAHYSWWRDRDRILNEARLAGLSTRPATPASDPECDRPRRGAQP
jgi:hypothetical protein